MKLGIKDVPGFLNKCIQLFETTVVRHGLMLVGPTGSGKTKVGYYEYDKEADRCRSWSHVGRATGKTKVDDQLDKKVNALRVGVGDPLP